MLVLQKKAFRAAYMGPVLYESALSLQKRLMMDRRLGRIPDMLLLLQHPSVITTGRFRGDDDVVISPEQLLKKGMTVIHTDRGGGATLHSPGQLVGYPIINLRENNTGVRQYFRKLEKTIINALKEYEIQAYGYLDGVWTKDKKICSIGIHVAHSIAIHGFALNVCNDLSLFDCIRPCGLSSGTMTSVSQSLNRRIEVESMASSIIRSFSEEFGLKHETGDCEWLTI